MFFVCILAFASSPLSYQFVDCFRIVLSLLTIPEITVLSAFGTYLFPFLSCTITNSIASVPSSILISVFCYCQIILSSLFLLVHLVPLRTLILITAEVMNVSCSSPHHVDFAMCSGKKCTLSSPICTCFAVNRNHELS